MHKIYYLFSKTKPSEDWESTIYSEAIYVCDENNATEKPILKTRVYPMGALLSKVHRILDPLVEDNIYSWSEKMADQFKRIFSEKDSSPENLSYSNIVCDDPSAQKIFELLLLTPQYTIQNKDYNRFIELLRFYMRFIDYCQKERDSATFDNLNLLSNLTSYDLPRRTMYVSNDLSIKNNPTTINFSDLLSKYSTSQKSFSPSIHKSSSQPLFQLVAESTPSTEDTSSRTLTAPLYVYEIHDVVDLILSSLQCIFEQDNVIGKCLYCESIFVTHGKKRKYCPTPKTANKIDKNSCNYKGRRKVQSMKESIGLAKKHKSRRTVLARSKYPGYEEYMECYKVNKDRYKNNEITYEEFDKRLDECYDSIKKANKKT